MKSKYISNRLFCYPDLMFLIFWVLFRHCGVKLFKTIVIEFFTQPPPSPTKKVSDAPAI